MMAVMVDNITLMLETKAPPQLHKAKGQPFEYKGQLYCPRYRNGQLCSYEAQIKNLRLCLYPEKVYLLNSLHKFYKGNNYSDFTKSELRATIEEISDITGIRWEQAEIKKLEYGCNIPGNGAGISATLQAYKGKDYLPMAKNGKAYGKALDATKYTLKGYDKQYQVQQVDKLPLSTPLFRWEVVAKQGQYLQRILNTEKLTCKKVLNRESLNILGNDATIKFEQSLKKQSVNLHLLTAEQKKIIAVMHDPEIRQDFKIHHKEAYKKYNRIYRQIMQDKSICPGGNTGQVIKAKFDELIAN